MPLKLSFVFVVLVLSGCASRAGLPITPGESRSGFAYVPLDPLPVSAVPGEFCPTEQRVLPTQYVPLLESLPDNAVRMGIAQYDSSGSVTFGPAKVGGRNEHYEVILDYVNVDTVNVRFLYGVQDEDGETYPVGGEPEDKDVYYVVQRLDADTESEEDSELNSIVIPVYIGAGLRLASSVSILRGEVNLTGLPLIAAEAEAGNVVGSLSVQTLGVTGPQVVSRLPLPSELNQTTVQNAILAIGSIMASMQGETAILTPRVTGLHDTSGELTPELLNLFISELASRPIPWVRHCIPPAEEAPPSRTVSN